LVMWALPTKGCGSRCTFFTSSVIFVSLFLSCLILKFQLRLLTKMVVVVVLSFKIQAPMGTSHCLLSRASFARA
jgi:hypothetical protein